MTAVRGSRKQLEHDAQKFLIERGIPDKDETVLMLADFAAAERALVRLEDCKAQCCYCAGVKDELESVNPEPYWTEKKYFCNSGEMEGFIHATSWGTVVECGASAIRALASPAEEKEGEKNG
jgi:hypothetical protein